jgi:hypothetical protein
MIIGDSGVGEAPGIGCSYTVRTISFDIDALELNATHFPDGPSPAVSDSYTMGTYFKKFTEQPLDMYMYLYKYDADLIYNMDIKILDPNLEYSMGMLLVKDMFSNMVGAENPISALLKAWAYALNETWKRIQTFKTAMQIKYAINNDLDDIWGAVYKLPRRTAEIDSSYRDRLANYTNTMIGCGTKVNTNAIIDNLTGEVGSTNIEIRWPGNVIFRFDTDTSARTAKEKSELLNLMIPQMLAAGISYSVLYEFCDLNMSIGINGPVYHPYYMNMLVQINDQELGYVISLGSLFTRNTTDFEMDILVQTAVDLPYNSYAVVKKAFNQSCIMYLTTVKPFDVSYQMDLWTQKIQQLEYDMYMYSRKSFDSSYKLGLLTKRKNKRMYGMGMKLI